MRRMLFIFLWGLMWGCLPPEHKTFDHQELGKYKQIDHLKVKGYEVIVILYDGHEYIIATNGDHYGGGISIIHSPKCRCGKK